MSEVEPIITSPGAPDLQEAASYEEAQRQGFLARAYMAGGNALSGAVESAMHSRPVRYAVAGAAALGFSMGVAGVAEGAISGKSASAARAAAAIGNRKAECLAPGASTVSLSYVDKAVLPLAKEVIDVYDHTAPSERQRKNNTSEMSEMSYRPVTEISAYISDRLAHSSREGTYDFVADFKGRITPKNMVAVWVEEYPAVLGYPPKYGREPSTYEFELARSTTDGPTSPIGMHWLMDISYGHGSQQPLHFYASKTARGSYDPLHPHMTAPVFKADTNQAIGVLKRLENKQLIEPEKDLVATQKVCR